MSQDHLPSPRPTFAHLDLDQFFVSVERLLDPSLRGRPLIVGGADPRSRGAVACASYEARAFGVHAGMALRRALALCPQATFVSGSFHNYLARSRQVLDILEARVPRVVPRSIDEFDLELTGCERLLGDPRALVESLRREIHAQTGLTCSAGLAGSPLCAKVAAGHRKPDAFLPIPPGGEAEFLAPLPLRDLPGVGPRTEERLRELGLSTVGELAAIDEEVLLAALGARGAQLGERARGGRPRLPRGRAVAVPFLGQDATPESLASQQEVQLPRSLSRSRTFAEDQDDRIVLDAALLRLVEQAVAGLRVKRLRARSLALHVRYADLRVVSRHARIPREAEELRVVNLARRLLERLLERRLRVRRLGVALLNLVEHHEQLTLFEGPESRSRRALGHALDTIRGRHGFDSIHFAAAAADEQPLEGEGLRWGTRQAQREATVAARGRTFGKGSCDRL